MGKYKRLSEEERWEIIQPIVEGKSTISKVEKQRTIDRSNITNWIRKYQLGGLTGLENGKGWKQYPTELKKIAVEDTVLRNIPKQEVLRKYGISDIPVLCRWIKGYNSGKELVKTSTGRIGTIMTKGRKTTLKERIEITQFAIGRNKDYKAAMEKYNVSYHQLYSWVKKYEKSGVEGLKDSRGRNEEPSRFI